MFSLQTPELLLLALPISFAWRRWVRTSGTTGILRIFVLILLLLALSGPQFNMGGRGIDVVVVADNSRSMPAGAEASVRELIRSLEKHRGPGDQIGIIAVGADAAIERPLSGTGTFAGFGKVVVPDGSDLAAGVLSALNLVDPRRPARIVVLSDGEANGVSPQSAARRAREAGVPIDYRHFERLRVGDVAVQTVELPEAVALREPFQFAANVYSDRETQGNVRLRRNGQVISEQTGQFTLGMNRLRFADVLPVAGLYSYEVEVTVSQDPLPENNVGAGVVRVEAGPRLLVLNSNGAEGNLAGAMRAAGVPVDVAKAAEFPLTLAALDPYRGVIVENVPAAEFGRIKMERLAQFAEELAGGLLLTGGERSFGTGGYFRSPLDEVLPVSMEMREEHRKNQIALAIVLDRSGSMSAVVRGTQTKMDLANLGTAECIRLLSPQDRVAVLAVDTAPHVIQRLTPVDDREAIVSRVLRIKSEGGGIYVYEALVAAGQELALAEKEIATRHIILFSDASDSEEPGDYQRLLAEYRKNGITVSVIGLGTDGDSDAALLKDVAKRGEGNIMFTNDPEDLPRLFTQDTMSVARNTFVTPDRTKPDGIGGKLLPEVKLLGDFPLTPFPQVGGYNLSYLKPEATQGAITLDEYQAPLSAFWYRGLGRVAALTLEVDGKHTGAFADWDEYAGFLATQARWLLGGERPRGYYINVRQDGQDALVTVELDPERAAMAGIEPPELVVVVPGDERGLPMKPDFTWSGPATLEARFRLNQFGTYYTLLKTPGGTTQRGPAVTLPYSPEFQPRNGLPSGESVLRNMAELTGGVSRVDLVEVLKDPPRSPQTTTLVPWLLGAAVLLLIVEIAGRRLSLWERFQPEEAWPATPAKQKPGRWKTWWQERSAKAAATKSAQQPPTAVSTEQALQAEARTNVYDKAKQRAKRRLE